MHPERVTVWYALWSGGIIAPFFFEDESGNAVTVNDERYPVMINQFFVPQLEAIVLDDKWFQQDGATCHTARETLIVLREFFPNRINSRFGDKNWPPRSCDLTPLDFWLWGHLKSQVYANKPATTQEFKTEIRRCINETKIF